MQCFACALRRFAPFSLRVALHLVFSLLCSWFVLVCTGLRRSASVWFALHVICFALFALNAFLCVCLRFVSARSACASRYLCLEFDYLYCFALLCIVLHCSALLCFALHLIICICIAFFALRLSICMCFALRCIGMLFFDFNCSALHSSYLAVHLLCCAIAWLCLAVLCSAHPLPCFACALLHVLAFGANVLHCHPRLS